MSICKDNIRISITLPKEQAAIFEQYARKIGVSKSTLFKFAAVYYVFRFCNENNRDDAERP